MNKPGLQTKRIGFVAAALAFALVASLISGCVVTAHPRPVVYGPPPAEVGVFYDTLSPYGEWIVVEQVGRVWRPHPWIVGAEFEPYVTGGYWVNTDAGWSFKTEWVWGWAPFHYGRWYRDGSLGWVWVPGTTWAPAWVEWRYGGGYVGWAPLPPPGVAVVYHSYQAPWVFVPTRYLVEPEVRRYALPAREVHVAFAVTQPLHPATGQRGMQWHVGPPPGEVARAAGRHIASVPLNAPPPAPGVVRPVTAGPPHTARAGAPVPPGAAPPPSRGGISSPPVAPGHPSPPPGPSPGSVGSSPHPPGPAPGSPSQTAKPPSEAPANGSPPAGHPSSVP